MRYDDRIEAVLGWIGGDAPSRTRAWVQLLDLIALGGETATLARAINVARQLRPSIVVGDRRATAARLAAGPVSGALAAFLAEDAEVAAPFLSNVMLAERDWAALLPNLATSARAVLARRSDLPATITAALVPAPGESQIVDLLARIEAFQNDRPELQPVPDAAPEPVVESFAFSIDDAGLFRDPDGRPLGPVLGAAPLGVDGQAIGAWRARMAMADARLEIGSGPFAGVWRISASPIIDRSGALLGYRGIARTPRADQVAAPVAPVATVGAEGDGFLRAMHRLRDPLAALGEAELPGGDATAIARAVAEQGQALTEAIDRFEEMAVRTHEAPLDLGHMLERLHGALAPLAEARGVAIDMRIPRDLPPADVDAEDLERMVTRLVTSVVPLGRKRERIVIRLARDRERRRRITLSITRPGRLVGRGADQLRDPEGQDGPMLALGFALRLVGKLADQVGGGLEIADDRLILSLPARAGQARQGSAIATPVGL